MSRRPDAFPCIADGDCSAVGGPGGPCGFAGHTNWRLPTSEGRLPNLPSSEFGGWAFYGPATRRAVYPIRSSSVRRSRTSIGRTRMPEPMVPKGMVRELQRRHLRNNFKCTTTTTSVPCVPALDRAFLGYLDRQAHLFQVSVFGGVFAPICCSTAASSRRTPGERARAILPPTAAAAPGQRRRERCRPPLWGPPSARRKRGASISTRRRTIRRRHRRCRPPSTVAVENGGTARKRSVTGVLSTCRSEKPGKDAFYPPKYTSEGRERDAWPCTTIGITLDTYSHVLPDSAGSSPLKSSAGFSGPSCRARTGRIEHRHPVRT